jgi:hypothetical protein
MPPCWSPAPRCSSIRAQRTGTCSHSGASVSRCAEPVAIVVLARHTHLGLYHYLAQPARALGPLCVVAGVVVASGSARQAGHALDRSRSRWPHRVCTTGRSAEIFMSFATPAIVVTSGSASDVLHPALRWHPQPAAALCCSLPTLIAASTTPLFRRRHEMRPVIQYAQQRRGADDQMVVLDPASYFFYTSIDIRRRLAMSRSIAYGSLAHAQARRAGRTRGILTASRLAARVSTGSRFTGGRFCSPRSCRSRR